MIKWKKHGDYTMGNFVTNFLYRHKKKLAKKKVVKKDINS